MYCAEIYQIKLGHFQRWDRLIEKWLNFYQTKGFVVESKLNGALHRMYTSESSNWIKEPTNVFINMHETFKWFSKDVQLSILNIRSTVTCNWESESEN